MLNEELLTPQEKEIAKLKVTIQSFKKYDEERKKFYKDAMLELGQLRSYVQELEDCDNSAKRIMGYKKQIARLQELYEHQKTINKAFSNVENQQELTQLQFYKEGYLRQKGEISALTKRATELKKEINSCRDQISRLVYELYRGDSTPIEGEQHNA